MTVRQQYADPNVPQFMQVWINGESATGLPFVDVFFRSTGLLDVTSPTNILYELEGDREGNQRTTYLSDPMNGRMFAIETSYGDVTRYDTLEAPFSAYDGPGLFMVTRCAAGSDTTIALPTVMDYSIGLTTIRFFAAPEPVSVPAFEGDVLAYHFLGSADWHGSSFGGMTGEFEGWVAADLTRRVLKASVRIFIGSVTLELEEAGDAEVQTRPKE